MVATVNLFSQSHTPYDGAFQQLSRKYLHVYPSQMAQCKSSISGHTLTFLTDAEAQDGSYCPIGRVDIDPAGRFCCYLLGEVARHQIQGFVVDQTTGQVILQAVLAKTATLQGAYQSLCNSWLVDCDGDGNVDILTIVNLIDYEFPTAESPNISGTEYLRWRLEDGKMVACAWPKDWPIGKLRD